MDEHIFNDKLSKPDDEAIFSIIGDTELLWKQTFSYLCDNNKDIVVNWKYSNCGKYWVCNAVKKKNSIFRIHILRKNSFRISFPLGDKLESKLIQSKLSDSIKNEFSDANRYNTTRWISFDVEDSNDLENIKILIDLKTNK